MNRVLLGTESVGDINLKQEGVTPLNDAITVIMFPLPSPTNYALLANLITILSHVYSHVLVITGGFIENLPHVIEDLRLANKGNIYVYDIGSKLSSRSSTVPFFAKLFTYIKIQINLIGAIIKLHNLFKVALLFIGVPHMLPVTILLRMFNKKIIVY
jgi:hypothetical protein